MNGLHRAMSFGGILPQQSIDYVVDHFKPLSLKANENFQSHGVVAHEVGFVLEGVLRNFSYSKNGDDVTKYFIRQNQFAVDLESYYSLKPSETILQAVVDAQLLVIKRQVWDRLNEEVPKLYILTKSLTEATLLNKIKDNDFLNFGTAKEKYLEFVNRYPELVKTVPQQYIASYLKITPQSLSRIRKELAKNNI
ncbi:Crp/Fnr family transcriptional regulator [Chondrinema litorale]|uniref:Crp/Fnr family transcriptional regulator n=1 Tax=Chondrinema litorale TaxID=2994555 RepID=UPI0025430392|nr:Crp/Fnr family transcriptional regulator [Chondrinema litorale]UZR97932.1 Crp/Fnr family transcriptional regulator [Chondrinema litorale]